MYKFDEEKHVHTLNDKPLCGVTTVLNVISKPQLIQWSANMAVEYIESEVREIAKSKNVDWLKEFDDRWADILTKAKTAHRAKKEKAGSWGTSLHKAIELWIKEDKEPVLEDENQVLVFDQLKQWALDNKVEFLESEKHLWSEKLWIGGIMDLVLTIDGKKYIGDIKTSSGIYPEMWAQMGAYHLCLEEMNEHKDVVGYIIINLKKDGKIEFALTENIVFNQNFFKAALELYKCKQIADESIIQNNQ